MPQRTLLVDQPVDVVWERLQNLSTWEGIGGMKQLRDPRHTDDGTLQRFRFSIDTPLGTIDDHADVTAEADHRTMHVRAHAKGLTVTIDLRLRSAPPTTNTDFTIDVEAASFLTRPLASTLRHTLESGIVRESDRMVERLEAPNDRT